MGWKYNNFNPFKHSSSKPMKKLISILSIVGSMFLGKLYAQEFNMRINVTSCSTFVVQMQCINATYLPTTSSSIFGMDFAISSLDAISISVASSSNGFNIGSGGNTTENGYNVTNWAELSYGTVSTNFTINDWYDIASFNITGGTSNLFLSTTTETPTYASYYSASNYQLFNESGRSSTNGTLAKYWSGGTTDWSTGSNWCPNAAPTTNETIVISNLSNDPVLGSSASTKNIELQSGATLTLGGNTLTISGAFTGTGTIIGSSSSSISYSGTGAGTIYMDQTTPGTSNILENLTVNNSNGLTLADTLRIGGTLTLSTGTLTTGGYLILAATGTTSYGQINYIGSGLTSGNLIVEKYLSDTSSKWRQFSMPLTGDLTGFGNIDLLYSSHGTANQRNVYYWDATDAGGNTAGGWMESASSGDQTRGYSIYSNNSNGGLHDISTIIKYTGTYSNTDRSYDIKATVDPASSGSTATGWNLIGNPYPSNYDLSVLFTNWPGNVSYKAVHVWDATSGQYKAILGSGATIENYNTSGGTNTSTVLAPFQAFWVKANSDVSFSLSKSYRTTSSTGLGTFLKKELDLARLDVFDADSAWDQTVVYFADGATSTFDPEYDAYKLISLESEVPSIYAVNPDGIFSISGLNADNYIHTVPLGFRSTKNGKVSFNLNTTELDEKWFVYLEDKDLGIFYNLKDKPYQFNHTGNSDSRFVLHFQTYALSNGKLIENVEEMRIGGDGDNVYVYVPAFYRNQNYRIQIYDLTGKKVYQAENLRMNPGMNTLNLPLNQSAYYSIRIEAAEGTSSGKVFIR